MQHHTKIICTLGPSSDSVTEITGMVQAGMDSARLNFSHGSYAHHEHIFKNIKKVEKLTKKRISIMQDLQGPKIRVDNIPPGGLVAKKGDTLHFGIRKSHKGPIIDKKAVLKALTKGNRILIDDGLIELKVEKIDKEGFTAKVVIGGLIKPRKGVNIPGASLKIPCLTAKDKKDLAWGIAHNVDYIALSFVSDAGDIRQLKRLIKEAGKSTKVIAKIEQSTALEHLEEIIQEADCIMVARGDLGLEIPAEEVPLAQKRIIALANHYGKPVITATQVMYTMEHNPRPTRAEVSDAANAVMDGTDALMLSNESSVGKYPRKAVKTLYKIIGAIEKELAPASSKGYK